MTGSEINILVRVRAQQAEAALRKLSGVMIMVKNNAAAAGSSLDALGEASKGYKVQLGGASKAAADLARNLALIGKQSKAAKVMVDVAAGAELAGPAFRSAAAGAAALNSVMAPLSSNMARTAAAIKVMSTAAVQAAQVEVAAAAKRQVAEARAAAITEQSSARVIAAKERQAAAAQIAATRQATADANLAKAEGSRIIAAEKGMIQLAATQRAGEASMARSAAAMDKLVDDNTAAVTRNAEGMNDWSANVRKNGSQFQWAGRQIATYFTLPTVAAGAAATMFYMEAEKAWTMVAKVYGDGTAATSADLGKVKNALIEMSSYFGKNVEEVYSVAEAWASLGLTGGNLAQATRTTIEASLLGNMSLSDSTEGLIALQAQFKLSTEDTTKALADLNAISNQGPAELDDLIAGFARTGSIAHAAGLSIAETAGMIETLTPAVGSAANAGNGLKSILASVMAPTEKAADLFAYLGINTERWATEATPAIERLKEMGKAYEGLSDAGKIDAVNTIAGKYQMGRLSEILSTINSETGEFAKALRTVEQAADGSSKSMDTYQRELQAIMDSDPQKLAQAWQQIRNSLIKAITPMIPFIIGLVKTIARITTAFGNLSPATQKWIMYILLATAVLGPLIMILASFMVLIGTVGQALAWLANTRIAGYIGALLRLIGIQTSLGKVTAASQAEMTAATVAGQNAQASATAVGEARETAIVRASGQAQVRATQLSQAEMTAATRAGAASQSAAAAAGGAKAGKGLKGGLAMGLRGFLGPLAAALGAAWLLFDQFGQQIHDAIAKVFDIDLSPAQVLQGILSPFQMLVNIVPTLIGRMWNWVLNLFRDGASGIGRAIAGLPGVVMSVFRAVVRIIGRAAQEVYEAFSYINPFARHSPSLVENVTAGMGVVVDQFGGASASIQGHMRDAYGAISTFGRATAGMNLRAEDIEYNDTRGKIAAVDPAAAEGYDRLHAASSVLERDLVAITAEMDKQKAVIAAWEDRIESADKQIDVMNKTLEQMQKAADLVSKALEQAKARLEKYSNAPIKGMRAMSDAIFANEMAQKRLRLEIMKLEEAGQTVDDLKDKFSRLQGEIETLSGRREELRLGGAGSDILSQYDKMIADLKAQQGALATDGVSEIEKAQSQLEKLAREGERLDLENALKFDPLTRQIEQMTNAMEEMPFETIVAGIAASKVEIAGLEVAQSAANAAVEAQKIAIEGATTARDQMTESMKGEQDKLDRIQATYDEVKTSLDKVEEAMRVSIESAETITQKLEEEAAAAEKAKNELEKLSKAQQDAADGAAGFAGMLDEAGLDGAGLLPPMEDLDIDKWMEDFEREIGAQFDDIDLLEPIKNIGRKIRDWIRNAWNTGGDWLADIRTDIVNWFEDLPANIASAAGSIGSSIAGFFGGLWDGSGDSAAGAGGGVGVRQKFEEIATGIRDWITGLPGRVAEFMAGTAGAVAGEIASGIANGYIDLSHLAARIRGYFTGEGVGEGGRTFIGDMGNLGESIGEFVINEVVGSIQRQLHNISKIGAAIRGYFTGEGVGEGGQTFTGDLGNLGESIGEYVMNDVVGGILDRRDQISRVAAAIRAYFTGEGVGEGGRTFLGDLGNLRDSMLGIGEDIIQGLLDGVKDKINGIGDWISEHVTEPFKNAFKEHLGIHSPSTVFHEYGTYVIEGLINGILSMGSTLKEKVTNMIKDNLPAPVRKVLEMASPSKLFYGIGENVVAGLVNGITDGSGTVGSAAQALADQAASVQIPAAAGAGAGTLQGTTAGASATWTAYAQFMDTSLGELGTGFVNTYTGIRDNTLALTAETATQAQLVTQTSQSAQLTATTAFGTAQIAATATMATGVMTGYANMSTGVLGTMASMTDQANRAMSGSRDQLGTLSLSASETVQANFQGMADGIGSIFENGVKPVFDSFDPMLSTTQGWFQSATDGIGEIWKTVEGKTAEPARFVINDVYNAGVKTAWNKVNGWLGLPALDDFVAPFAEGGLVDRRGLANANNPRGISRGGRLTGDTTGDRTLFAGMGGEFVLNKKMVAQAGGVGNLERWRQAALSGGSVEGALSGVPGFADGGAVPAALEAVKNFGQRWGTGSPYYYGGTGPMPPGWDCSGWVSSLYNVATGRAPFSRSFNTESDFGALGFKRGLDGAFTIGVRNGGGGPLSHMAATIDGVNTESGGAHDSTVWGGPAVGSSSFPNQYTLEQVGGLFKSGGPGGGVGESMLSRVMRAYKEVMDPIGSKIPQFPGGVGEIAPKGFGKLDGDVSKFLFGKASEYDSTHPMSGGGSFAAGAGVEQWRGLVQRILKEQGLDPLWDQVTLAQMQTESSGNPNAINDWDINAINGTPSKGLMQVIDPTFARYRDSRYPDNIWDPAANIAASMRYSMSRYGSLPAAYRGVGYDQGGWLQPGITQAINASGAPEAILTAGQWDMISSLLGGLSTGQDPVQVVADGVAAAFAGSNGQQIANALTGSSLDALDGWALTWEPNFYDATKQASQKVADQAGKVNDATGKVAEATTGVQKGVQMFTAVGEQISAAVKAMVVLAQAAIQGSQGGEVDWGAVGAAVGGLLTVGASLLEMIPEQQPTYWADVDTAGMTDIQIQQLKAQTEAANIGKGLLQFTKDVGPVILKSLAPMAGAIGSIASSMIPLVAAAGAMAATGNIVGAAILLIPTILTGILTMVPLIIDAITQIVPALIQAIIKFVTRFMPNQEFAYDTAEAAAEAAQKKNAAQQAAQAKQAAADAAAAANANVSGGGTVNVNIYGDVVMPNITGGDDADTFVTNLVTLG